MKSAYKITIIKKASLIFFGFLTSVFLARYLNEELRGDYSYYIGLVAIVVVLLNFGLNFIYQASREKNETNFLQACYSFSIINFVLLVFFSFIIFYFLDNVNVLLISLIASVSVFRLQTSYYNLIENIYSSSYISIFSSFIECALLLVLLVFFEQYLAYAFLVFFIKELIAGLGSYYVLSRKYDFIVGVNNLFNLFKRNYINILNLYIFSILNVCFLKLNLIYLGLIGGVVGFGAFSVALLLSEYFWVLSDVTKDVQLSNISKGNGENSLAISIRVTIFLSLIFYFLFVLFGYWFVLYVYGSEYVDSYLYALFLIPASILLIPYKLISLYYITIGKVIVPNFIAVVGILLMIVFNILYVDKYGVIASSVSILLGYFFMGFLMSYIYTINKSLKIYSIYFISIKETSAFFHKVIKWKR